MTYATYNAVPSFIFSQRILSNLSSLGEKAITSWKVHKAATFWSPFHFCRFHVKIIFRNFNSSTKAGHGGAALSAMKENFTNFRAFSLLTPGCASIVMDFYFDAPRTVCFMTCSLKLIVMAAIVSMALGIMTFEERRTEKRCRAFHKSVDFEIYCSFIECMQIHVPLSTNTKAFQIRVLCMPT